LKAFDERGWPVTYAEGEPVLWDGDEGQAVYFITSGMVEVSRTSIDELRVSRNVSFGSHVNNLHRKYMIHILKKILLHYMFQEEGSAFLCHFGGKRQL